MGIVFEKKCMYINIKIKNIIVSLFIYYYSTFILKIVFYDNPTITENPKLKRFEKLFF